MAFTRKLNSSATSPPLPNGLVLVAEEMKGMEERVLKVKREKEGRGREYIGGRRGGVKEEKKRRRG